MKDDKCETCNGYGTVYNPDGGERICPDCKGEGKK